MTPIPSNDYACMLNEIIQLDTEIILFNTKLFFTNCPLRAYMYIYR